LDVELLMILFLALLAVPSALKNAAQRPPPALRPPNLADGEPEAHDGHAPIVEGESFAAAPPAQGEGDSSWADNNAFTPAADWGEGGMGAQGDMPRDEARTPIPETPPTRRHRVAAGALRLGVGDLRRAVILREVLEPPMALRRRR
jgi:hypothetical protein